MPASKNAERMGGGAYTEKAFINALFFDCSKSRKLGSIVKDKATGRCPHGVSIRTFYVWFINMEGYYIHNGVGSACCSSDNRGNARRLEQ